MHEKKLFCILHSPEKFIVFNYAKNANWKKRDFIKSFFCAVYKLE